MEELIIGTEEENALIDLLDSFEGEVTMEKSKIDELMNEVEVYKQAIQDAKDALASAEMELDAALEKEFEDQ